MHLMKWWGAVQEAACRNHTAGDAGSNEAYQKRFILHLEAVVAEKKLDVHELERHVVGN